MNKKIMNKTTFVEVCKIMKGKETDIQECIKGVLGIGLLFLPGLMCKDVAVLSAIANGVDLLTAERELGNAIAQITNIFGNREYKDFSTKYENAQIAHILIVFAAYFDSIKMYLPNEERTINLSLDEKHFLTDESIKKYLDYLKSKVENKAEMRAKDIFENDLSMPNPIESKKDYFDRLKSFYEILNQEFIVFFEKLSFWEKLDEDKRDAFMGVIRELPGKAVENYKKQYYELSIKFNDFFIWGNIQEHCEMQHSIDVGFEKISEQIASYYEKIKETKVKETLEKYETKYLCNIEEAVIDTSEIGADSAEDIVFPAKKDIFIPQSFKSLLYKNNMRLEQEAWTGCEEREDIGKFIADTIRHSTLGELPLLILGLPGAGKSLLCSMLAAKILSHEYHVIIIKLRDTMADETISQQISQQMKRDFSNACTWDDVAESGIDKPILLIFDGYDELLQASGRTYSDYIKRIAEFQKDQRNIYNIFVKCIITSRTILIDKALIMENTPVIKLSDFNEERIKLWSDIWNEKNEYFFLKNQLEFFEINESSKVYELAKQPLLLLMLALYDSNGNLLKKQKDMNSTQLYYSLIREFISREKRKEDKFRSKQESDQNALIDAEIRKISIAALGMYNKKALYIRSSELQLDIEFIEQKEICTDALTDAELKESDKVLGSFLFIHKSKSTDVVEREEIQNAAYEFLHNTFGEFLTAYFIVCEIYKVLDWMHVLIERNMKNQSGLSEQRAWYVCLAYAPLFSRPVVINMIHEWSVTYLAEKGMQKETIDTSMDYFITNEIQKIITGDEITAIKEIVEKKGNPFKQDEILNHLAVYSLNIIILATVVCTDTYTFDFTDYNIWNKLVCIWKYAFSDNEISDFANLFMVETKEKKCKTVYNYGDKKVNIYQNKIDKLFNSYLALGDEVTYSIIGALIGSGEKNKVTDVIMHRQLNINARYMWNYILNCINNKGISQEHLFELLREFNEWCWREDDLVYTFSFYLLIEFLLKENIIKCENRRFKEFLLEKVVLEVNRLDFYEPLFDKCSYILDSVMELSLHILEMVEFDVREIVNLFLNVPRAKFGRRGLYNRYFDYAIRLYNIGLKKIVNNKTDRIDVRLVIQKLHVGEQLEELIRNQRRLYRGNHHFTGEIVEISYNFIQIGEQRTGERLLGMYLASIDKLGNKVKYRITMNQSITFVRCLYVFKLNEFTFMNQINHFEQIIRNVMQGIRLRTVFEVSTEAAFYMCCLIEEEPITDINEFRKDLLWIANKKLNYISKQFYEQIYKLADRFGWDELKESLEW